MTLSAGGRPALLALALLYTYAAAAGAIHVPFARFFHARRLQQSPESDWATALRPIIADTITKWPSQDTSSDPRDTHAMSTYILNYLKREYNDQFKWALWIFNDEDPRYIGGPDEHYGISTEKLCDKDVVTACLEQGSMSGLHMQTDHGKYSWTVFWTASKLPNLNPAAVDEAHKAADLCAEANPEFRAYLSDFADCIKLRTDAAGVLVFNILLNPAEDGGGYDPKEFATFQIEHIRIQDGKKEIVNVRMVPNIKWYSAAVLPTLPPPEVPAAAPEDDDAAAPAPLVSEDDAKKGYKGDGCNPFYLERNCSVCAIVRETLEPTCLMCQPCFELTEGNTSCVPTGEKCWADFPLAPAPAPGPDIGEGCNPLYHEGKCSFCIIVAETNEASCLTCEPCFTLDATNTSCVPSAATCRHPRPLAPAPGPEENGADCTSLYEGGKCSFCTRHPTTKVPECQMCEPCFELTADKTCVYNKDTCWEFDDSLVPAPAPGPGGDDCDKHYHHGCEYCEHDDDEGVTTCYTCQEGYIRTDSGICEYTGAPEPGVDDLPLDAWDKALVPAPGPDDENAPLLPGQGCDPLYHDGNCMFCKAERNHKEHKWDIDCVFCQPGYVKNADGSGMCVFSGAPEPSYDYLALGPSYDEDAYNAALSPDEESDAEGPDPDYSSDYALPPAEPPIVIPPGQGCTGHYLHGCMFCFWNKTRQVAVCQDCQSEFVMEAGGKCRYVGRSAAHHYGQGPSMGVGKLPGGAEEPSSASDGSVPEAPETPDVPDINNPLPSGGSEEDSPPPPRSPDQSSPPQPSESSEPSEPTKPIEAPPSQEDRHGGLSIISPPPPSDAEVPPGVSAIPPSIELAGPPHASNPQ